MGAEPQIHAPVRAQLTRLARRLYLVQLLAGACRCAAALLLPALALFLLDNVLHLPAAARLLASLALMAWGVWQVRWHLCVPLLARWSPERVACLIERSAARGDNLLINACQLEALPSGMAAEVFTLPVSQGARAVLRAVRWQALAGIGRLVLLVGAALAAVLAWGGYRLRAPDHLANALERFALPLGDVPPLGSVRLRVDPDHDVRLTEGDTLAVRVQAAGGGGAPVQLLFQEGVRTVAVDDAHAEVLTLPPVPGVPGSYAVELPDRHRSLAFRIRCADSCSRAIAVQVLPAPRVQSAQLQVTPPAYLGGAPAVVPGPPAPATVLAGAELTLTCTLDQAVAGLSWQAGPEVVRLTGAGTRWQGVCQAHASGSNALLLPDGRAIAQTTLEVQPDAPPTVALSGVEENRLVLPGTRLLLGVQAQDDHGLAAVAVRMHAVGSDVGTTLGQWRYLGPPGPGAQAEQLPLTLDGARFPPGGAVVLEALAWDRCPGNPPAHSAPLLVRVRALDDIHAADGRLEDALQLLLQAIRQQRTALGMSDNAAAVLAEVVARGHLAEQAGAIAHAQRATRQTGGRLLGALHAAGDARTEHALTPVIAGEMTLVVQDCERLAQAGGLPVAQARLEPIRTRQAAILQALLQAVGEIAAPPGAPPSPGSSTPASPAEAVAKAASDLKAFIREQEAILTRSRSLAGINPLDLSDPQAQLLGALASREAAAAKSLEEAMTDFSKLPNQDFADAALGKEINQVWQDITAADAKLYAKSVEVAVPLEQSGLELAKELEQNLEKWMSDHRDNIQWKMEEALAPADVPVSQLPKALEDIVGDLLDKEDQMGQDVEDFSSAWMDNIDKGAGWDAADGPISNMSAKGITGNQLPNQNEIGGRSGEGRNGRSHGQMVQDTAEGKGGRATPDRMDPQPFEAGAVKDTATGDDGGPTGGGKVSGQGAEGLHGPVPPPLAAKMARLAGMQAAIRQQAGVVALTLRRRHLPSGDVETAVAAMQDLEHAAARGDGGAIRQRYAQAVDALRAAQAVVAAAPAAVRREGIDLAHRDRDLTQEAPAAAVPGYEDIANAYFRALAAQGQGAGR